MSARRILVTGGAGFIGSSLAIEIAAAEPSWEVVALDNLHRRGSELNIPRLRAGGVAFVHGDIREPDDLAAAGHVDALVECSAEPSVMAGVDGATSFLVRTNLLGAYHCLEAAAATGAQVVFLSTSRVYPVAALERLSFEETDTRFAIAPEQELPGAGPEGISERFPLEGARTLYGATKLSAELLIAEYRESFGIDTVVNRCGVVTGPWQMGKVDQGVFMHWLLAHHFRTELRYFGYGGEGRQVRDLLHVDDLGELVLDQLRRPQHWSGQTVNVGGGTGCSLSLRETTEICAELTGNRIAIGSVPERRTGDVRVYISDCSRLRELSEWAPRHRPEEVLSDMHDWVLEHESLLSGALAVG